MHIAFPVRYITSKISAIIVLYAAILWYAARNAPEQGKTGVTFSSATSTNCQPLPPLVQLQKGRITMLEASEGFRCRSRCVLHGDESYYRFGDWVPLPTSANFSCDIVESDCWAGLRRISQMHSQIFEQSIHKPDNIARPDVILIILDSVSSSMAKRSLPKSIKFLKEEMQATQMEFLNTIADYSKPNGFALAFGKSIRPLKNTLHGRLCTPDWNVKDICRNYLDKLNYYIHQYGEHGYKTMVANDGDRGIVFYPNCVGFKRPEADHIWRPFDLRRADFSIIRRRHELLCSEPHTEMLNYLQNFVDSYEGVPKIGQLWITGLAHGGQKDLYHADDHFFEFFSRNREKLDNSFIFFMGDHGPRVKGILEPSLGFYELKNPVLLVTMPKKYRNTEIHLELQKKSHQLMTPFDVHATLMDILMIS
ncbi:hypothetical protein Q1695_002644 [Nippostrongylus brasiliensis]|nr:hypothetical protein Q1695_002644 [Nippostrongylus brasiliensis]